MKLLLPPPRPPGSPDPPAQSPPISTGTQTQVWLVRHAEVAPEFHGLAYGAADVPLSERGREQSREVAAAFEGFRVARIYASPSQRTQELAALLAATTGAAVMTLDGLREIDRGAWQGGTREEFRERWHADAESWWNDPWHWRPTDGECDAEVFARAWPEIQRATEEAAGAVCVVCTHANTIRALLTGALGLPSPAGYELAIDPAHAHLLVDAEEGWVLREKNLAPGSLA
jgi:broad specificity phosphatase PhoE